MVIERKRLLGIVTPQLLGQLSLRQGRQNYELLPLLPDLVRGSRTLTAIPDIFDRLIVAEARRLGLPLISHDPIIRASGLVNLVWD